MPVTTIKPTDRIADRIGTFAIVQFEGIQITCEIIDVRANVYGRTDYNVKPIHGAGQQWVSDSRVVLS